MEYDPNKFWMPDAAVRGRYYGGHPAPVANAFVPNLNFLPDRPPPSPPVEDRRYMTSPHNPFTKAADRFSMTKGYYLTPEEAALQRLLNSPPRSTPMTERPNINLPPEEIDILNKAFEEYIRQNQAPRR
jgi:hypothetical protein